VTFCRSTRVWIVNPYGSAHRCGNPNEVAFRRWRTALMAANAIAAEHHLHRSNRDRHFTEWWTADAPSEAPCHNDE
jgi:hypothetical protein